MNVTEQARQAYAPKHFPLRTPRSVEAELISQVTANLKKSALNPRKNFPALVAALHDNRSSLPAPLRAQIFYLAEFTEQHSTKVLNGKADSDVLVEINTAILRGLNQMGTS